MPHKSMFDFFFSENELKIIITTDAMIYYTGANFQKQQCFSKLFFTIFSIFKVIVF